MTTDGVYRIRPAGRHVLTIGRDLIQDCYAAVVELVKNAYDADSPDVSVEFRGDRGKKGYSITIADHGHGMSREDVIERWLVPSTPDKLERSTSPGGRTMQGRKGVGRFAASILGSDLLMETVTVEGEKTTVFLEWKTFEDAQYLDDVEILIESEEVSEPQGTRLIMNGGGELLSEWDQRQFSKLRFELRKLISPVDATLGDDRFLINLTIDGFPDVEDVRESVEPYPIFELFDYRIRGRIAADGTGTLEYSLRKIRNTIDEVIQIQLDGPTGCGGLLLDVRVYDREKDAIDSLIQRGLKDKEGHYVGKLQARQLLNDYNGIGVYRNGFRIRPLGDPDFDWLTLNEQRVQNPSLRIGSNQAIGYVQIQSDEQSGLIEKSARDGLKENRPFEQLKQITQEVIAKLEERRFQYRRKVGLGKPSHKVEGEIERLYSFEGLRENVQTRLTAEGMDEAAAKEFMAIIDREEEEKNQIANQIRQAVAVYQGQATLGKIVNVILHEGRRPLNYFRNQIPNLKYWYEECKRDGEVHKLEEFLAIAEGVGKNAGNFVDLFRRLDPLASGRRSKRRLIPLKSTIRDTVRIFESDLESLGVCAQVIGPLDFRLFCWSEDIYSIFTNLIDNSLYWMRKKGNGGRILVQVATDEERLLHVDYRDTGPGIEATLIESEVIFEPEFSTKPSGTGLGLAIAGESASRNGLELIAFQSDEGAWFRLQTKGES